MPAPDAGRGRDELIRILRDHLTHFGYAAPEPPGKSRRRVCRAIIRSSSLGMIRTVQGLRGG